MQTIIERAGRGLILVPSEVVSVGAGRCFFKCVFFCVFLIFGTTRTTSHLCEKAGRQSAIVGSESNSKSIRQALHCVHIMMNYLLVLQSKK